ncbi:histone acetyltransferase KAT6A-like isoform X2 [Actinia tenebrosa]|uniref:Histone acetyltransferase KAT6A-like isoform X2 n=1 Tax=Actinia tenebrosa TaxID=6105 RepID=A0A6P8J3Q1_ACTTE|nr:histone acetyltransferase KAT6A-like isoform X2 [Actinia tenebrosa]
MAEEKRPKYMNWILECINLLRSRKSRPDLERICRTMLKCHGVSEKETEEDLRALVEAKIVTRRSFKGAISYRNSAGWSKTHGPGRTSRAGRWVTEAIRVLDRGNGVSTHDVERYVEEKHPYYSNIKPRIKQAVNGDVENGKLWMVGEGRYRLLESAETSECNKKGQPEDLLICRDCGNKAHPTCMNYSTELSARIRDDATSWQCIDCKTCVICNDSGDPGSLLFCDACDKGYHMQCHVPPLEIMPSGKWICYNCENHPTNPASLEELNGVTEIKVERRNSGNISLAGTSSHSNGNEIGNLSGDEEMEEECTVEVKDMHVQVDAENVQRELEMLSQTTPPRTPPLLVHSSTAATSSIATGTTTESKNGILTTLGASNDPSDGSQLKGPNTNAVLKNMSADASKWAVSDVIMFLESVGFSQEAKNFAEQEIDGKALLLMSRNDVLTGMSLKLGPALKIYVHVSRLQKCQPKVPQTRM